MRRTKTQALSTRAKILDAAETVFVNHGVTRTALNDIADAAGVTRGAIYGHFRNKAAIFEAIFERSAIPLDPFIVPSYSDAPDSLDTLKTDLDTRLSDVLGDGGKRRLYRIALTKCEVTEETAAFCSRVSVASRHAEAQVERAWQCAIAHEQIPPDIDARQAAAFIHSTLTGFLYKDLLAKEPSSWSNIHWAVDFAFHCLTQR